MILVVLMAGFYTDENLDSTKRLSELINVFSKVADFKMNIQKLVAGLYMK
jgi:hypothetical protein